MSTLKSYDAIKSFGEQMEICINIDVLEDENNQILWKFMNFSNDY